jgi:hypothetical protein
LGNNKSFLVKQSTLFIHHSWVFGQSKVPFRNGKNAYIVKESEDYRVIRIGYAMKTKQLNRVRRIVITEALIDYIEHYYEESGESDDILFLVHEHFDEFVQWAYDDILISSAERDLLLHGHERELNESIKTAAVQSFSYITDL